MIELFKAWLGLSLILGGAIAAVVIGWEILRKIIEVVRREYEAWEELIEDLKN